MEARVIKEVGHRGFVRPRFMIPTKEGAREQEHQTMCDGKDAKRGDHEEVQIAGEGRIPCDKVSSVGSEIRVERQEVFFFDRAPSIGDDERTKRFMVDMPFDAPSIAFEYHIESDGVVWQRRGDPCAHALEFRCVDEHRRIHASTPDRGVRLWRIAGAQDAEYLNVLLEREAKHFLGSNIISSLACLSAEKFYFANK